MAHFTRYSYFIFVILLLACGGNVNDPSPTDNAKDRKLILTHWVENIIVPSYENFQEAFEEMEEKASAFTASPNQNTLTDFRNAWVNAYVEWQKVELFEFGPAENFTLRNFYNIYPTDVSGIATNMNDPSANLDLPASYARQGFPALDYLINGVAGSDDAIIAAYSSDADAAKRTAYVNRIVSRMRSLLTQVISGWNSSSKDSFINSTGLDIGSSTGLVVNAYVLNYERFIRSGKIGIPSGAAIGSSGTPYPERIEAFYKKDISRDLANAAHQASLNFFNGKNVLTGAPGPSLRSYLDALGAKDPSTNTLLSVIIGDQFDTISSELNGLSPNFYEQIQSDNEKMIATYAAMQKLVRLLKVDMTSAMSVTITYTDNDGD